MIGIGQGGVLSNLSCLLIGRALLLALKFDTKMYYSITRIVIFLLIAEPRAGYIKNEPMIIISLYKTHQFLES